MKKMMWFFLLLVQIPNSSNLFAATVYTSTPDSKLGFVAHTKAFDSAGSFEKWQAKLEVDENGAPKKASVNIEARSLTTGLGMRDNHLRSKDFFNVDTYRIIRFLSSSISVVKDSEYKIEGRLQILNREIPLVLTAQASQDSSKKIHVKGGLRVNRSELGLGFQSKLFFVPSINEEVDINFDITLQADK